MYPDIRITVIRLMDINRTDIIKIKKRMATELRLPCCFIVYFLIRWISFFACLTTSARSSPTVSSVGFTPEI